MHSFLFPVGVCALLQSAMWSNRAHTKASRSARLLREYAGYVVIGLVGLYWSNS